MSLSNQQAILLDALRAGSVHSHDARDELRIGNPSERVNELRELGCEIDAKHERRGRSSGVRYRLRFCPPSLGGAVRSAAFLDVGSVSQGVKGPTSDGAGVPQRGPGVRRLPAPVGSNPPVVGKWQLVADYLGDEPRWYRRRTDLALPQMELAAA